MSAPKPPTNKQLAHLRALAHHLAPVVQLGKDGLGAPIVTATRDALLAHELIKVKLPRIDKAERRAMLRELVDATGAQLVAEIGRVAVLYKRHPSEPKIGLPK